VVFFAAAEWRQKQETLDLLEVLTPANGDSGVGSWDMSLRNANERYVQVGGSTSTSSSYTNQMIHHIGLSATCLHCRIVQTYWWSVLGILTPHAVH
jgi:hypothetical protein